MERAAAPDKPGYGAEPHAERPDAAPAISAIGPTSGGRAQAVAYRCANHSLPSKPVLVEPVDQVPPLEHAELSNAVLVFGSLWVQDSAGRAAERHDRGGAKRRPKLERRTLNDTQSVPSAGGRFDGYALAGRWYKVAAYGPLRNSAWMVRNSRHGQANNPAALRLVVAEVGRLVAAGERLPDVVEALCELLVHP